MRVKYELVFEGWEDWEQNWENRRKVKSEDTGAREDLQKDPFDLPFASCISPLVCM